MSWQSVDELDRTAKILIDLGLVRDPDGAGQYLERMVLQVAVGPEIIDDATAQAALLTTVNAGRRAFKGGVHVALSVDPVIGTGWGADAKISSMISIYGGTIVNAVTPDHSTLVIGLPKAVAGKPILHLTWDGWAAGVVQKSEDRLGGHSSSIAGVLAAGLGISEAFQQALGNVVAGRRDIGISLWRPDLDWRSLEALGPAIEFLPAKLWLIGLGHLGQAYAWTLGLLPYKNQSECDVGLMDFDRAVAGNMATQMLTTEDGVEERKSRILASALQGLGFSTRVVERAFDEHFRVISSANPDRDEPLVALCGFDDAGPRRLAGGAGFELIVDAGLGAGPEEYLDIVLHTFPAAIAPADAYPEGPIREQPVRAAYEEEIRRQVAAGADETAARCGILDIAGVTVGAAFVGVITSTLVIADLLRVLHDGASYAVIALDLREPNGLRVAENRAPRVFLPKFTRAAFRTSGDADPRLASEHG
jgi:hypothetical protein